MFRQILMEGPLSLVDSGKSVEMFIILFDDMLLITRRKKALSKKVEAETSAPCVGAFSPCVRTAIATKLERKECLSKEKHIKNAYFYLNTLQLVFEFIH